MVSQLCTYLKELVRISGEYTRTQSVDGVIGDSNGFRCGLECRHTHHGPEDLLLEDSHLVVPSENSGLHVVPTQQKRAI